MNLATEAAAIAKVRRFDRFPGDPRPLLAARYCYVGGGATCHPRHES